MEYDVTVRNRASGFLIFEFRIKLDELETHRLYQDCIKNEYMHVTLTPVEN